ncbi:flagellar motor switch protein [Caballeronia pedi]|uniref:Flagellar motor switch protein n=1 Tax=Caballeronia pedi TaxID=1777141 RepID=A0A158C0W1_9BURK|nr:FliM/FliN family flagellar motor C-terminal domain-containing protein [Caballeronia pedi]SAK75890.1 flagellar motor switch protein [Caballeronia pedi]
MNAPVRWRPLAQSDLDVACTMMEASIALWRDDWFGSSDAPGVRVTAGRIVCKTEPWSDPQLSRLPDSDRVWWSVAKEASRALAGMALGLTQDEAATVSGATCPPFTMLGERIIHELSLALASVQHRIPQAIESTSEARLNGVLVQLTTQQGQALCSVLYATDLIIRKSTVARSKTAFQRSLTSRRHALAATKVQLHARLGRAALAIRDLLELAPGDVIRLDRKVDEGVELFVQGDGSLAPSVVATGRLGQTQDRFSVQLDSLAAHYSK